MAVTVQQLREELANHYGGDIEWYDLQWDVQRRDEGLSLESLTLKFVHQEGGEGEGSTYFYVFSTGEDEDEQLWRVDGYYASWDGVTYDDYGDIIKEVKAVVVPTVQYHAK